MKTLCELIVKSQIIKSSLPKNLDVEIRGITNDSSKVETGFIFFALNGMNVHGMQFAKDAVAKGALLVVTDENGIETFVKNETKTVSENTCEQGVDIPYIVVQNPRAFMANVSAFFYDYPTDKLVKFGVTGTNGKTTVVYAIEHILKLLGRNPLLMGTIANSIGVFSIDSWLTTPESFDVQKIIKTAVDLGATDLAMEVSSHSIDMNRIDGVLYDVACYTNLSHDHLDYHKTIEQYFETKAKLFTKKHAKMAVINIDDEHGKMLYDTVQIPRVSIGYSSADFVISDVLIADNSMSFTIIKTAKKTTHDEFTQSTSHKISGATIQKSSIEQEKITVNTNMIGKYNAMNIATAIVAISQKYGFDMLKNILDNTYLNLKIPGRLEFLDDVPKNSPKIIVDYAHNPVALQNLLETVQKLSPKKLFLVFGAPGKRDVGKRSIMGKIASENADEVIVTDDEPHFESAKKIRSDIIKGIENRNFTEIAPRKKAIEYAVKNAKDGDIVILAGRGHENTQEINGEIVTLNDATHAKWVLHNKETGEQGKV
jgi:UDP-N-acetylmuramoyl-L-alanyl-D-glutamate--2,6-diaminopimelate ligase